jgi:hypothetical protein
MKPIEAGLAAEVIAEWKASPELRAEFGEDITRFAAYKRAAAQGLVHAVRSVVVSGEEVKASVADGGIAKPKKDGKKAKKEKKNV